jgi:hypothetical protein
LIGVLESDDSAHPRNVSRLERLGNILDETGHQLAASLVAEFPDTVRQ